jgi:DNA-binding MltR family transcriptional regulator
MLGEEFDLSKRILDLQKNSEAAIALVTVAIIDEWLQKLILTAMLSLSQNVADRIFGSRGPLYGLASKADIAFAFRLIEEDVLSDVRLLRDIRNKFAHTTDVLHFDSPEIAALCRNLSVWTPEGDNSTMFDVAAIQCIKKIDAKTEKLIFEQATNPETN